MTSALPLSFDRAVKAAAIVAAFIIMTAIATNLRYNLQTDFVSFWAASKLTLLGMPAAAYDLDVHRATEITAVAIDGTIPFTYPPPYLFAILPLGLLPYAMAHAAWVVATFAACVAAAHKLVPGGGMLAIAFPPAIICGIGGQNSFLVAAIFMAGMVLLKSKPFLAGVMLGLIIFKPHLGVLLPLALIAGREWRAFAGAAVSTVGLMLLSILTFGWVSWTGFAALLPLASEIAAAGLVSWNKMASVYATLRLAGVPDYLAVVVHGVLALAACVLVWHVWRTSVDIVRRAAVLGSATLLISPYVFIYDQMLLVPALAYLWRRDTDHRWLVVIYAAALVSLAGNFYSATTVNFAPIAPLLVLAHIARDLRRRAATANAYAALGADCRTPSST